MPDRQPAQRGAPKRAAGFTWTELMKADARPVPESGAKEPHPYRGPGRLPASRYTSAEFAQREREKMWPNVWQFAAREEDMPAAGDYIVYENAGRSYIVTRQDDGSVRAFHNVSLHRGRRLPTQAGTTAQFLLPFHP